MFYLLDVGLSLIEVGGSFEQAYGSVFSFDSKFRVCEGVSSHLDD